MNSIEKYLPCKVNLLHDITTLKESGCEALCVVDKNVPGELKGIFDEYRSYDKAFDHEISIFRIKNLPIIYSPIGDLTDYHDVRIYQNATFKAVNRAVRAGFQNIAILIPSSASFKYIELCTMLAAFHELYVPIQLREDCPDKKQRIESISFLFTDRNTQTNYKEVIILEAGKQICRDIGVGDPERMAPPKVEKYIRSVFTDQLQINVISDINVIRKDYPLFEAVNRAAQSVERHQGRIIFLEYKPPQKARKTLMLVGKGVTYDTGGADIKAGGVMAGMSRDKCGAAAVAGFMKIVAETKPVDIHVIAALCMVRNSVGEECYVSDEVITSRAGVRVRVGNTDAEGRMCMADALCHMKEMALSLPDPHLFTIATLTGHAGLAVGEGYSIVIDNIVARKSGHANNLQMIGEAVGEPFEISTLRHDDFDFNSGKVIGEDLLQCNNEPSSRTPRGHQIPAAFMIVATGLDKHGLHSDKPLKYTHLDIAASAGEHPHIPTAAPIVALAKTHLH